MKKPIVKASILREGSSEVFAFNNHDCKLLPVTCDHASVLKVESVVINCIVVQGTVVIVTAKFNTRLELIISIIKELRLTKAFEISIKTLEIITCLFFELLLIRCPIFCAINYD